MSHEALANLRRGHEAFSRGDLSVMIDLTTPDVQWGATGAFPGVATSYQGRDAIQEWADLIRSEWEEFEVGLDEVLHDGGDVIVVAERLRGRGRGSGAEVEMCVFAAYWLADEGRISKRAAFTERDAALKAAGVLE
jgi:ketosteroid isomerase-like protein